MDTDAETTERQLERWRAMNPAERVAVADQLSVDVALLAIAGIRSRRPDATDAELRHELARRRYGDDIADRLPPSSLAR